jgi:hypothetical protein
MNTAPAVLERSINTAVADKRESFMNPCGCCIYDPDICSYHPCNGCGADDDECSQCQVLTEGFDCNCFQKKEE